MPLYNAEHVFDGVHLSELGLSMQKISRKESMSGPIKNNERPRYHYLKFPDDVPIVDSIADFKHYFSVNINYLERVGQENYVCSIAELYRESLSQRFAAYLARIGLP